MRTAFGRKNTAWQLQEAKAKLSEVINAAMNKPQIITIHGKETAMILSIEEYKKLAEPKQLLYELIQNSPLRDTELELPQRLPEKIRKTIL
ncbi:MAG: type II toxin-antitoxin system Phd/YefM family antitoxin [Spirochaetes bacterium]|nr:type II toxin-antitoxin system Phd/YefM family antitoxin [Spirochaetota bacterium]